MIIAGAEVAIGAVAAAFLAAHDHRHLGVGLPLDEAVDDLDAGALERVGPHQILLLVEARLQFDHGGDRLAGLGGGDQGVDHRRLLAGAVERLLDRDDAGILGGLAQEGQDDVEALIRVVDDDVLGADRGEAIAVIFADPLGEARRVGREFEVGPVLLDQQGEVGDAEEAGRFEDQGVRRVDALADQRLELVGNVGLELEADHPPAPPALQRGAEEADQVLGLLLDLDVAVADDPEGAAAQ